MVQKDEQFLMYEGDGFIRHAPFPESHPAIDRFLALFGAPEAVLRALTPAARPVAAPAGRLKNNALGHR